MSELTSRKRVRKALKHEIPDKMPIDFGAMRSTGIHVTAYQNLKRHLNINSPTKVYDVFQQLAEPEEEILEIFQADVIQLSRLAPAFGIKINDWRKWQSNDGNEFLVPKGFKPNKNENGDLEIKDGEEVIARMPQNGLYFDKVYRPLAEASSTNDIDKIDFPVIDEEELEWLEKNAKRLYEDTDYAILGEFGGNIFEAGQFDFGYERYYLELGYNSRLIKYYHDKLLEHHLYNLEKYLNVVGDYIDVIQFGDDLGMQNSSQISVEMYKNQIKPYHEKQYKYVRANHPDTKVFLHSCGSIYNLIPELINAGVEILNPVQISAKNMNPKELKDNFGDKLIFWGGGCDTQTTLTDGSIEEIERETKNNINIFKENSGYVFTQVHNIQANIDPEKILAMYKTAINNRNY